VRKKFRYNPETDEVEEVGKQVALKPADAWQRPKHLEALAVEMEEVPEAMAHDRLHGVPTDYDNDGCPVITGPRHYNAYCKSWGYVNRSSVTKGVVLAPGELERASARVREQYPCSPSLDNSCSQPSVS